MRWCSFAVLLVQISSFLHVAAVAECASPDCSTESFFQENDANGDGTLQPDEVRDLVRRVGGDWFHDDQDVVNAAEQTIQAMDHDRRVGIQSVELRTHWDLVTSRLSVDDVADWVTNAVQLPQYAAKFKENAIKGLDLPILLEGQGDMLGEIGVAKALHRHLIMRSITVLLMGAASPPPMPNATCVVHPDCSVSIMLTASPFGEREVNGIPVHKWRVYSRHTQHSAWDLFAESYDATALLTGSACSVSPEQCTSTCKQGIQPHIRVETWNSIGRSPYQLLKTCKLQRFGDDETAMTASTWMMADRMLVNSPPSTPLLPLDGGVATQALAPIAPVSSTGPPVHASGVQRGDPSVLAADGNAAGKLDNHGWYVEGTRRRFGDDFPKSQTRHERAFGGDNREPSLVDNRRPYIAASNTRQPYIAASNNRQPYIVDSNRQPFIIDSNRQPYIIDKKQPPPTNHKTHNGGTSWRSNESQSMNNDVSQSHFDRCVMQTNSEQLYGPSEENHAARSPDTVAHIVMGAQTLFTDADKDGDGDIDAAELAKFIQQNVHQAEYSESSDKRAGEIEIGVETALDAMDINKDRKILLKDIERHWRQLATLLTPEKVGEWVSHAVLLPEYADRFVAAGIAGLDLPQLLDPSSNILEKQLGIENKLHRIQITRAIKLSMMAIAVPPDPPQLTYEQVDGCGELLLAWSPRSIPLGSSHGVHHLKSHRFVLKRAAMDNEALTWSVVYAGNARSFVDAGLKPTVKYAYQVETWNVIGPSEADVVENVYMVNDKVACASTAEWMLFAIQDLLMMPVRFVLFIIVNYNLIYTVMSVVLWLIWLKLPTSSKEQLLSFVQHTVFPKLMRLFEAVIGSKDGQEAANLVPRAGTARSPTNVVLTEAANLLSHSSMLSRRNKRSLNIAREEESSSGRRFPGLWQTKPEAADGGSIGLQHGSDFRSTKSEAWKKVKKRMLLLRVANAFRSAGSGADPTTRISFDSATNDAGEHAPSPTSSPWRRASKGIPSPRFSPSSFFSTARSSVPEASIGQNSTKTTATEKRNYGSVKAFNGRKEVLSAKRCMACNTFLGGMQSYKRHYCGVCHGVYCVKHMAVVPHTRLTPCAVKSRCVCKQCVGATEQ